MNPEKQPCTGCEEDPIGTLKQLFVDRLQVKRIRLGQSPALRPVFSKTQGVAHGWFEPLPELDEDLRVGVFGMGKLEAWVRFSSDCQPSDADGTNTLGIGIKLFGVQGEKLLEHGDTQDFLLQNHDVFMVPDVVSMCQMTREILNGRGLDAYTKVHHITAQILKEMAKTELSALSATYWSALPYRFGQARYVKYKLAPRLRLDGPLPAEPNYLAADLGLRLKKEGALFDLFVQFQRDPQRQPLDDATIRWEESETAPVHVAKLCLPAQDINTPGQTSYGQNLAFQPWHSLREHEPVGSIALARRVTYEASARVRRTVNGISVNEPGEPRRDLPKDQHPLDYIAYAAIYPPIGIARVGDSKQEYFYGPEVTHPEPRAPGFYRDSAGALKRQAARFSIYGLNESGIAVKELTADIAEIEWTVQLANKKAAWYQFQLALDIPEAVSAAPSLLRNMSVQDRKSLRIEPKKKCISGINRDQCRLDDGLFLGKTVYLGELLTDQKGRLIVLGGRGAAESSSGAQAVTFANNDGWHDDTSDGPVTAEVTYDGRKLRVDPAWVVVAPPNYAPLRKSVRTMWDVIRDAAINANALARPVRPSFNQEIRPILERLCGLQWVNAGFAASFGFRGPNHLADAEMLKRLARNDPSDLEFRRTILNQFRNFDRDSISPQPWPWQWGDAMNTPPLSARAFHALSGTQLGFLNQWAIGDFESDYDPVELARTLEAVPVANQPEMLTRAALEFCVADAFHPGSELTWPMRNYSMYMQPFRISPAADSAVEPDFGPELVLAAFTSSSGPLGRQWPGGLTRWLGVPWQTDAASCGSGYAKYDPYLPTFWPARVPNQVLTAKNYAMVMDQSLPMGARLAAFAQRADWMRPLGSGYINVINNMVADFGHMGVIEQRPGPGCPEFPARMEVESDPTSTHQEATAARARTELLIRESVPQPDSYEDSEKACRFPRGLR
jgi:hypothetical protein